MDNSFLEYLKDFGFTGIEATIYETLLKNGAMTGYEVSKETGISRSNVYSALAALADKGAAYLSEGEATKYLPVEIKTFTDNFSRELKKKAELLVSNAPKPVEKMDGYITINGTRHIEDKIREMLSAVELRVYFMAEKNLLWEYMDILKDLSDAGKKIVILSREVELKGATVYDTDPEPGQIRLITDSKYVLTGSLTGRESDTCLYSGQPNLVDVMKEALKNRISLIELNKEDIE